MDAVVLENVCKSFGHVRAVDSLSVRVPRGCIYGFLGPNGAGKTTTIRMIMDIILPDSGRMSVLSESVAAAAKDRVGYMPEERGLYRRMTVASVLTYIGSIKGLAGAQLHRQVGQWLERVGLAGWARRKVQDLSRGMHQKLQFAAAAVNDPELLILDEPFSGLDPVNLDELKAIVLSMRDEGKTIIFSTHMMDQAERLSDFILLINDGRKVVDGTLAEIRSRWAAHAVAVELDGPSEFVDDLPMVAHVERADGRLEIALAEGGDTQELLGAIMGHARVLRFERKISSLHEIFVNLVGSDDE